MPYRSGFSHMDSCPIQAAAFCGLGGKARALAFRESHFILQLNGMKCSDSACWNHFSQLGMNQA